MIDRTTALPFLALFLMLPGPAGAQDDLRDALVPRGTFRAAGGLVSVKSAVRLRVVEADRRRTRGRAISLRLVGGDGQVLRSKQGRISGTTSAALEVTRGQLDPFSSRSFPVRFEIDVTCDGPEDPGPILTMEIFDEQSEAIDEVVTLWRPLRSLQRAPSRYRSSDLSRGRVSAELEPVG